MLQHLSISNYALIEQLDIDFTSGFSVITGETGAGKSIILGALGLLRGNRADAKAIKAGAQKCCVEAEFNVRGLQLDAFFQANELDFDGETCIVRREVTAAGKSRAFLNDTPVALTQLKQIASYVIDVHSQHQNLLMGREDFLLDVLDDVAENSEIKVDFEQAFTQFTNTQLQLKQLKERLSEQHNDAEYLEFQLQQLEEANLQPGEQRELEQEQEELAYAEDIKRALCQAHQALQSDEAGISQLLRTAIAQLNQVEKVYTPSTELIERLESCKIEIEDIQAEVEQAAERIEYNPERLNIVEERLSLIYSLQKKHHCDSIEQLIALRNTLSEQLNEALHAEEHVAKLTQLLKQQEEAMLTIGAQLTGTRQKASEIVGSQLVERLQHLGMPAAQVAFTISKRNAPERSGLDRVGFMFSANKNVPMQDVAQIASGGEIARLMLSVKAMLAAHRNLPTIVFDEIDTGVSGKMAESMARVMQQMSQRCQVICITHLPQIAALGSQHYFVYKTETEEGTTSNIVVLNEADRLHEIATMLSGANLTEAAIENAKALLNNTPINN